MAKILVLHHAPYIGGGSVSFIDLLTMLAKTHEVVACCPTDPPEVAEMARSVGVQFVAPPEHFPTFEHYNGGPSMRGRMFWKNFARTRSTRVAWRRFLEDIDADLMICNSAVLAPLGGAMAEVRGRSVCFVRETLPNPARSVRSRVLYRMIDRSFDGVLCLSEHDRSEIERHVSGPVVVSRDVVNASSFVRLDRESAARSLGVAPGKFHMLFCGGDSEFKGLRTALAALRVLRDEDVRLIVAGYVGREDGPRHLRLLKSVFRPVWALRNRSVQRGIASEVAAGRLALVGARRDMSACYSLADVVLFPAQVAHQSRPLLEASFYGIPAICSDYDQYREHLAHPILCPKDSPESFARAVTELIHDPESAVEIGHRNRQRVVAAHAFAPERDHLLEYVDSLLEDVAQ
jgi:glycosyltransferase involved in cell wall biosynthesis